MIGDRRIAAAVVAALMLRLFRLDAAPLWFDEVITARWMALGWSDLLAAVLRDNHPPLYFLVLKAWTLVAGTSTWALRAPSVLFSVVAVVYVGRATALLAGATAAPWAAWFAALSPYLVQHAQEARMYGLVTLAAAVHLASFAAWLGGIRPRLGVAFVASAIALASTHYYTVFLLGGEVLVLLLLWRRPLASWMPAASATVATGLAAFGTAVLLASHHAGGSYEIGLVALPGAVWAMLAGYAALPDSAALHAEGARAVLPFLPLALAAIPPVLGLAVAGWRGLTVPARIALLVPFATLLAAPFAAQLVLDVGVNPRYFIAAAPGLLAWFAAGAARSRLGGGLLAAVLAVGLGQHLAEPAHGREDIRAAGTWLDANVPPTEELLVTSSEMEYLATFHWPSRRWRLWPPARVVARADNATPLAAELPASASGRTFYVVGREWLTDPDGALRAALRARYRECPGTAVRGIRILCFERDRAP